MKNYAAKANESIVKAILSNKKVVGSKCGDFYIITIEPFHMAHLLTENQIYFNLDKIRKSVTLSENFKSLLALDKTLKEENKLKETGAYYSSTGKDFIKEFSINSHHVWVNVNYTKDIDSRHSSFYQESCETNKKNPEASPVLILVHGVPSRIVLPVLKNWTPKCEDGES